MSACAKRMKYVPMRLPTPREPLCSMNHTRSDSSRQTSMKWLPVPSVPRWCTSLPDPRRGCLATRRAYPVCSVCQRSATCVGRWPQAPRSVRPPLSVRPCGTVRSMALRMARRLSGRSTARSDVRTAIMPQPMSTPTAAGTIAPTVGMTLPTVAPIPQCTSGIAATQRWMNGRRATLSSCCRATSSTATPRIHALIGTPPSARMVSYAIPSTSRPTDRVSTGSQMAKTVSAMKFTDRFELA